MARQGEARRTAARAVAAAAVAGLLAGGCVDVTRAGGAEALGVPPSGPGTSALEGAGPAGGGPGTGPPGAAGEPDAGAADATPGGDAATGAGDAPEPGPPAPADPASAPDPFAFRVEGGARAVAFGEALTLAADIDDPEAAVAIAVEPVELAPFLTDHGDGTASFRVDEVDVTFQTTVATFTLEVDGAAGYATSSVTVKVLGNVWVTDLSQDVVQVFRSDGSFLAQGISNTFLDGPWSLHQLDADHVLVGSRWQGGAEVYDLEGAHVASFQTEDAFGTSLFSIYGAYSVLRHAPDGRLWLGGRRGQILVYDDAGAWQETLWLDEPNLEAEALVQLPDGTTVACGGSSLPWALTLLDEGAATLGPFANNAAELPLVVEGLALADPQHLVAAGRVGKAGFLALVRTTGQMVRHSAPLDFVPAYGLVPFGDGFLAATDQGTIARFDRDLALVDPSWTGEKTGTWRGLMVLGGN